MYETSLDASLHEQVGGGGMDAVTGCLQTQGDIYIMADGAQLTDGYNRRKPAKCTKTRTCIVTLKNQNRVQLEFVRPPTDSSL